MIRSLQIVVAVDASGGFAKDGKIPWNLPDDLKRFKELTVGQICIMGRTTYEDILDGRKKRDITTNSSSTTEIDKPMELLRGRESIVLSSDENFAPIGARSATSLRVACDSIDDNDKRLIFIIGGRKLFIEALSWDPMIHLTVVKSETGFFCDRFFPMEALKKYFIASGKEYKDAYFLTYVHNKYKAAVKK